MDGQESFFLRAFHEKSSCLLDENDREYLHTILKEYQQYRDVPKMLIALQSALDTPIKLDLLKEIRALIPLSHLKEFDRLAPYNNMANPFQPHKSRTPRRHNRAWSHRQTLLNATSRSLDKGIDIDSLSDMGSRVTVNLDRSDSEENLGFCIRGGSEHGLGIFVSQIESESAAEHSGLCVGDHILEVNNVPFGNLSSATAVHILTDSASLRMIVRRLGKVPGFKFAKEKTAWYDVTKRRIVQGSLNDHGTYQYPSSKRMLTIHEFRVHLRLSGSQTEFGFNIRGGNEYGLGVYVSSVDPGGLAEVRGMKPGQQLVDVNGVDFESICHALAVEIIRSHRQLVLTLRDVGRYPAYKELYAKYSWHTRASSRPASVVPAATLSDHEVRTDSDTPPIPRVLRRHRSTGSTPSLRSLRDCPVQVDPEEPEDKGTQTVFDTFSTAAAWPEDDDVVLVNKNTKTVNTLRRRPEMKESRLNLASLVTIPQPRGSFTNRSRDEQTEDENITPMEDVPSSVEGNEAPGSPQSQPSVAESTIIAESFDGAPSLLGGKSGLAIIKNEIPEPLKIDEIPTSKQIQLRAFRPRTNSMVISRDVEEEIEKTLVMDEEEVNHIEEKVEQKETIRRKSTFRERWFGGSGGGEARKSYKLSRRWKSKDEAVSRESSAKSSGGLLARLGMRGRRQKSDDDFGRSRQRKDIEAGKWSGSPSDNSTVKSSSSSANTYGKEVAFNSDEGVRPCSYRLRDINELAVEEMARKLFNKTDRKALLQHVRVYASGSADVEEFGHAVLPLLAKPEQVLILRELRGVLRLTDVGRFDSMVGPFEVGAYEELASRRGAKSAKLSPKTVEGVAGPPKKTIMEPVPDHRGHYYLQTPEEFRQDQERRIQIENLRRAKEKAKRSPRPLPDVSHNRSAASTVASSKLYLKKHECKKEVRIRDSPSDIEVIPSPNEDEYPDNRSEAEDDVIYDVAADLGEESQSPPPRKGNEDDAEKGSHEENFLSLSINSHRGRKGKYAIVKRRQAPGVPLTASFATSTSGDTGYAATDSNSRDYETYNFSSVQQVVGSHVESRTAITLAKVKPSIGISVSGGRDNIQQPHITVDKVFPNGAATGQLRSGMLIHRINDIPVDSMTHREAVETLRRVYNEKDNDKLVLLVS